MAENCPFEVVPLAQSRVIRNAVIPNLQYTHQDYSSLLNRMIELIRQRYDKEFNEFQESSLAVMLLDMWAFLGDQLSFKIDQIANEFYPDTVTELANAMRLARFVGFKPTPPLPARAMFSLTLNHPLTFDLPLETPIPVSLPIYGGLEKTIELFAADSQGNPLFGMPIIIPADHLHNSNIVGIEGKTQSIRSTGAGGPYQRIVVPGSRILWGSVKVSIDGAPWNSVEYFTDSHPRKEYKVEYSKDWRATIFFGNNITGMIPPKGSNISVSYRTGGGVYGNVVTGAINRAVTINSPELGYTLVCQVQNYTKAEGGYDGDTIEDIRRKLPLYLKTQDRAVTGYDYKALVDNFVTPFNGAVGKSTAVLRTHGCAANIIDIYLLARDGILGLSQPNANLKTELSEELAKKKMFTDTVCLRDGSIVQVDIQVNCTLDRVQRSNEANIRERVMRRIYNFFSLANWEFGQSLRDTDIVKTLADIKELEQIDVAFTTINSIEQGQGSTSVVHPRFNEIIRPDNIAVEFSYK